MSRWWIDEPSLLGSSNPDAEEFARLRAGGFDTLICLLDTAEQPPAYDVLQAEALGWRWIGIPVRDFTAPTVEQLTAFVRLVDDLPETSRAVVHCQGEPDGPGHSRPPISSREVSARRQRLQLCAAGVRARSRRPPKPMR